jgi:hypothetical protein
VPFPRTRRYEASSQPTIAEQPVAREREIDAPSIASSRMIKIPPVTAPAEIKATPPPVRKDLTRSKIDKTIETVRTEEPIGEEKRTFDQSRTTASSVETIGLSHTAEWTVTVDASEAQMGRVQHGDRTSGCSRAAKTNHRTAPPTGAPSQRAKDYPRPSRCSTGFNPSSRTTCEPAGEGSLQYSLEYGHFDRQDSSLRQILTGARKEGQLA